MVNENMTESEKEQSEKKTGRVSVSVSLKFSPKVWEKFKEMARREELGYSMAVELLMSEALERGYIVKSREEVAKQ
jgi:hypothetical protein